MSIGGGRGPALFILVLLASATPAFPSPAGPDAKDDRIARIDSLASAGLVDSALSVIARLLPEADAAGDSSLLVAAWLRQGKILVARGQAGPAEAILLRATDTAWAIGDTLSACRTLRALAGALAAQGRLADARPVNERVLSLARAHGYGALEAWARTDLGRDAWIHGRPEEAIEHCRAAIALFHEAGERSGEAQVQNGLGTVLVELGRHEEARPCFLAAGRLGEESGAMKAQLIAENNLGALEHSLGDPGAAVAHYERSLRLNRRIGNVRESIVPGANLARCNADLGRWTEAADSLEAMLRACEERGHKDLSAIVLNALAEVRVMQGRPFEARSLFRRVLQLGDGVPMKNRVGAAIGLAECLAEIDSAAAAVALLDRSLAVLASPGDVQGRVRLELERGELLLDAGDPARALASFEYATSAATDLDNEVLCEQARVGRARVWTALGRADSARARWAEAAHAWEDLRSLPADPEWREARGKWSRVLATEMVANLLGPAPRETDVRSAYDTVQRFKARTLLERMGGRVTGAPNSAAPHPSPTVELLQTTVLREDELLLDVYVGPARSWLFAIDPESCRVYPLPAEEAISERVRLYGDLLRTPPVPDPGSLPRDDVVAALDRAGRNLHSLLFGEVGDLVRAKRRIYVSPDGPLNTVPFGVLADSADRGREWIRVPSSAVLTLLRARARGPAEAASAGGERGGAGRAGAGPRILALASATSPGGRLRGVRDEVRRLTTRYESTRRRLLGPGDSVSVGELAGERDILHIASHSTADDERPWLSALELGASRVRAAELAAASIPAKLAVLSSCQSQHGRVLSGEGVLGLSTALLCAGSDCVVATLWPVEDRATSALMEAFYEGLASGRTVAGALQAAQASLRAERATAHPFYWSGFVAIGRGEITIPLRERARVWLLPVAAGAAILVVALIWRRPRNRPRPVIGTPGERLMG